MNVKAEAAGQQSVHQGHGMLYLRKKTTVTILNLSIEAFVWKDKTFWFRQISLSSAKRDGMCETHKYVICEVVTSGHELIHGGYYDLEMIQHIPDVHLCQGCEKADIAAGSLQ